MQKSTTNGLLVIGLPLVCGYVELKAVSYVHRVYRKSGYKIKLPAKKLPLYDYRVGKTRNFLEKKYLQCRKLQVKEDLLPVFFDIAGITFYFSIEKLAMENASDDDSENVLQDYRTPQSKGGLSGDVFDPETVFEDDEEYWPERGSGLKKRKRTTSSCASSSASSEPVKDHEEQVREHIAEICGRLVPPRSHTIDPPKTEESRSFKLPAGSLVSVLALDDVTLNENT